MKRQSQQGVALVITLILLSVITFMAVTFLVVSRHEGAAVNTLSQQSNAKYAADEAQQRAMGEIASQMLATTNGLNFGLMVSTNYVQPFYTPGTPGVVNITNVSYNYQNGASLTLADLAVMMGNLQILPRAPVFIVTNKAQGAPLDFRSYLDLNRNGLYDPSGPGAGIDLLGNPANNYYTGDPEWIGILSHPDLPHSASNFFIGRYCFIALPIGDSLDLNYSHNQAKIVNQISSAPQAFDGFIRNQGVGSWEINLAGFLNSLNGYYWGGSNNYHYVPTTLPISPVVSSAVSPGNAFADAASLAQYRYNSPNFVNLNTFRTLFDRNNPLASSLYYNEYVDGYGVGPLMLGTTPLGRPPFDPTIGRWSGDDCPNPFFSTQDLFNVGTSQNPNSFAGRLYSAGTNINTGNVGVNNYNRYTFYRLFAQMGFGSAPESAPYPNSAKMNLNYANATSFQPWKPVQFFVNAANAMLTNAGYPFTVTNIPIYPNNFYTPGVHRLLQLAANIYDASTNKTSSAPDDFDYPSVFRPQFSRNGTNIFISGYVEEVANTVNYGVTPLALPRDLGSVNTSTINIYGIPWVIGARKGLPNFNEFSMESICQVTRKLQVAYGTQTNAQYSMGISNLLGVEAWNSYTSTYPRGVRIVGVNTSTMLLTNELGILVSNSFSNPWTTNIIPNQWRGFPSSVNASPKVIAQSFVNPLFTSFNLLSPGAVYHPNLVPHFSSNTNFDVIPPYIPRFGLNVTNRLFFAMIDQASGRVIDYVSLDGMAVSRNLMTDLASGGGEGGVWSTNIINGQFEGVAHQIQISAGNGSLYGFDNSQWIADSLEASSKTNEIASFGQFLAGNGGSGPRQAPYTPTANIAYYSTWQANDPLVHYTLSDLTPLPPTGTNFQVSFPPIRTNVTLANIGLVNKRYVPWALPGTQIAINDPNNFANLAVKDPQVTGSDAWQFPTNKYPNIGWLGRVHRGTPWQTVYLKSPITDSTNWQNWSGNLATSIITVNGTNYAVADAQLTHPTNDWKILDLFTTALNDNASRGQLSVNQPNLAAWAAVLDGVFVLTNETVSGNPTLQPQFIDPSDAFYPSNSATAVSTVPYIVSRINAVRGTNAGQVFSSVGQILSVPELSVASPYINTNVAPSSQSAGLLTDAVYERIPQQIMSLLRVGTPRYVIFAYGQSLKPADHSIVQSGQYFGMCTNYQITGETATRTLVRYENFPIPGVTNSPRAVVESFNVLAPGN